MLKEVRLTIFIVAAVLVGLAFLVWFFYSPVKRFLWHQKPRKLFYRHVMRVVLNGDYYCVNDVALRVDEHTTTMVDHIIGGDKFLYIISDRYYEGVLKAHPDEPGWLLYQKHGQKVDLPNPLLENQLAMERLSIVSGINTSFMVGIVLINDSCFLNPFSNEEGESLLVPLSKLESVIASYEKRKDVEPFLNQQLWQTIQDLHELGGQHHE